MLSNFRECEKSLCLWLVAADSGGVCWVVEIVLRGNCAVERSPPADKTCQLSFWLCGLLLYAYIPTLGFLLFSFG